MATPALAGKFDVPPANLEKSLSAALDQLKGTKWPEPTADQKEGQSCERKNGLSCNLIMYDTMIEASGTELPPKTESIIVIPYKTWKSNLIFSAIYIVMVAYDPGSIREGFTDKVKVLLDGMAKNEPSSVQGADAAYNLEIRRPTKDLILPVVVVTPR